MKLTPHVLLFATALIVLQPATAQRKSAVPAPRVARSFRDTRYGVTFQLPAEWDVTRRDHEVSTFALDARFSDKLTQLRAVASINFNPYPQSTFSGALFYFSVTPRISSNDCAHQVSAKNSKPVVALTVAGAPFIHGYDEHGGICTESRDEIYTTMRNGACYRFDLVINNFCGGEVSGVRDISAKELENVRHRLEGILDTVQFDKP